MSTNKTMKVLATLNSTVSVEVPSEECRDCKFVSDYLRNEQRRKNKAPRKNYSPIWSEGYATIDSNTENYRMIVKVPHDIPDLMDSFSEAISSITDYLVKNRL